ncbi:MAG TPA: sulfocyanin-like copper-binding protein [Gemmatimonadales bacterium]|nr:sulfocyanin-like copper-binding protein [Gemmatimonadales bacterium]
MTKAISLASVLTLWGAGLAPGAAAQTVGTPTVDPRWLTADSASRTASFELIAGLTGANGALNFDGFHDGTLTLGVPVGWTVVLHFRNHDGMLPHSAEVIDDVHPLPTQPVTPAFPRAETLRLVEGLVSEQTDEVRFIANQGGSYLIFCGVPGHGAAGMWIRLVVSASLRNPSLAVAPAANR